MRFIRKQGQPRELIDWKCTNRDAPQNLIYNKAAFPREAVLKSLLSEQSGLCAYTMRSLKDGAHIEHYLPQSLYPEQSIDFNNMLACYPAPNSGVYCPFGAEKKANFDPAGSELVSPLVLHIETHFKYLENGLVQATGKRGQFSIDTLGLNFRVLINDRRAVIKGSLHPKGVGISAAHARRLADFVLQPNEHGELLNYCVAVSQVALKYAAREESRAARKKSKK